MGDDTAEALEGFASTAQVAGAERVARALTVGFALCDEAGFPLSERQRISMFTAALLGFDGFHAESRTAHERRAVPRRPLPPRRPGVVRMPVQERRLGEPARIDRHEFRCEECGYGAVARIAPDFCPMCRGSVRMLAGLGPAATRRDGW